MKKATRAFIFLPSKKRTLFLMILTVLSCMLLSSCNSTKNEPLAEFHNVTWGMSNDEVASLTNQPLPLNQTDTDYIPQIDYADEFLGHDSLATCIFSKYGLVSVIFTLPYQESVYDDIKGYLSDTYGTMVKVQGVDGDSNTWVLGNTGIALQGRDDAGNTFQANDDTSEIIVSYSFFSKDKNAHP